MTAISQPLTDRTSSVVALILLIVFAVPSSASDERSSPPEVGDAYQETIDTAWNKAAARNDPSMTCAALKGRVAGTGDQDAFPALFACNQEGASPLKTAIAQALPPPLCHRAASGS